VMDGRGQRRITAGHRTTPAPANSQTPRHGPPPSRSGEVVALGPSGDKRSDSVKNQQAISGC